MIVTATPATIRMRPSAPSRVIGAGVDGAEFVGDLAPEGEDFQDYVIVHELLHLRYRDHGKQFKAMMTALVPNWRELEKQSQHATEDAGQGRREMEA